MLVKRIKLVTIGMVGLALLCGFVLVCCTRSPGPGVTATPPRATDSSATAETKESDSARPETARAEQPDTTRPTEGTAETIAPTVEMDVREEPEPEFPRYLEIVEEIDPARRASIGVTVTPPRKLELNTQNVKLLRLTREGLPLTRNRSIVLQIDGQGIEWTPKYVAVELQRSPAGEWTVVRRRPYEP